LDVIEER